MRNFYEDGRFFTRHPPLFAAGQSSNHRNKIKIIYLRQVKTKPLLLMFAEDSVEDNHLFARIAEGDESSFSVIFRSYVRQLRPFIFGITRSDMVVDEIIQETFLRVWVNRDKLPFIEKPKHWVFRIAANLCNSWLRRTIAEKRLHLELSAVSHDRSNSLKETLELNEVLLAIREAVSRLSPQRRKVYQLNREQGLTVAQIAEQLHLSSNTVRNTLSSSLGAVREHLQSKGYSLAVLAVLSTV